MPSKLPIYIKNLCKSPIKLIKFLWRRFCLYWRKNFWHKLVVGFGVLILICLGTMYGIARWYIYTQEHQPLTLGVTYVPDYAESLGLDPKTTFLAILNQLHVKQIRLTSYWSDMEPSPGIYDFSMLDWEMKTAEADHVKVLLSIGLRQPRWPECHMPNWADSEPESEWQPQLESFMTMVVNRYKSSASLEGYELENEYFLHGFGTCTNFSRQRLVSEYNLVKKIDPNHEIILARSNNLLGWPVGKPTPNEFGISVYKKVWDVHTHRYFNEPIPAWYYAFLAGVQKIFTGRNMIIDELQAEPWPANGKLIPQTSLAEQNITMSPSILSTRIKYGEATGMRTIDLWGAEYWYYRMTILHDPSLWNVAKNAITDANKS